MTPRKSAETDPTAAALDAIETAAMCLSTVQDSGAHNRHATEALGHLDSAAKALWVGAREFARAAGTDG